MGFPEEHVEDKPLVHHIKSQCFVLNRKMRDRDRNLLNETQIFSLVPDSHLSLPNKPHFPGKTFYRHLPSYAEPSCPKLQVVWTVSAWSTEEPAGQVPGPLSIENAPFLEDLPLNVAELIPA